MTGPRGCGKTTLLLHAYDEMVRIKNAFFIYVNFKTLLKIEPLYKKNYNGYYWFKQWLLLKTYEGIFDSVKKYKINVNLDLIFDEKQIRSFLVK